MVALAACGGGAPPAPPLPTVVAVADAGGSGSAGAAAVGGGGDGGAPEAHAVPEPADAGAERDPCRGGSFDLDSLPRACVGKRSTAPAPPLQATLRIGPEVTETAAPPPVRSGQEVAVTLTFTNRASAAVPLAVSPGCALLEAQAYSGNNRADYVSRCAYGAGCGGHTFHLVLEPGGTLVKHLRYKVVLRREDSSCKASVSPLPPGRYELRIASGPFFSLEDAASRATASLVVTR